MSETVFRGLSTLTRVVASSHRLDRALSGADVSSEAKRALINDVMKAQLDALTLDAAVSAIDSHPDLPASAALSSATVDAAFESGDLASIESSLHAIGALIETNTELRQALSDFAVDDQEKAALLSDILEGKADPFAVELVCMFMFLDHGRRIGRHTIEAAHLAATRRNTVMVDVVTAIELDEPRRRALTAALERSYNRSIEARFAIDPSIVGSVVVNIGDDVLDGSIRHRLEQARKTLIS